MVPEFIPELSAGMPNEQVPFLWCCTIQEQTNSPITGLRSWLDETGVFATCGETFARFQTLILHFSSSVWRHWDPRIVEHQLDHVLIRVNDVTTFFIEIAPSKICVLLLGISAWKGLLEILWRIAIINNNFVYGSLKSSPFHSISVSHEN